MPTSSTLKTASTSLRITEIFLSLQGESTTVGLPTVFVRTTGCPLRCGYCDTAYAFSGGSMRSLDDIVDEVARYGVRHVTITGGEPLAQSACLALMQALCDRAYQVSLETSGALSIRDVDARVMKVVDIKTPGSGESSRNLLSNLSALRAGDQLKFVLTSRADYEWSRAFIADLDTPAEILFSPSFGEVDARDLAEWILGDRLEVRFQIQLHKQLWGDEPGR